MYSAGRVRLKESKSVGCACTRRFYPLEYVGVRWHQRLDEALIPDDGADLPNPIFRL